MTESWSDVQALLPPPILALSRSKMLGGAAGVGACALERVKAGPAAKSAKANHPRECHKEAMTDISMSLWRLFPQVCI